MRLAGSILLVLLFAVTARADKKPNVVIILADDLGYGDVGCYGATKVRTPNVDAVAAAGRRFTDAHSTSGTCTPSRYSLLTGEFAWRKRGTGILPGDASLIIEPGRPTLPAIVHESGFVTAAVGKWHLGLGRGKVDWNGDIEPGPDEVGFQSCFIIPATGDRVPCVFIQDHRVVGFDPNDPIAVSYKIKVGDWPTGKEHPELLKMKLSKGHDGTIVNGISRIGFMHGGKAALWKDDEIAERLTEQATDFIEKNKDKQFLLYFATHDIHVPRVPGKNFRGKSGCGVRGDVIEEFDWSVGQVVKKLDDLKLTDNTLVIISSDNGPVVDDGYADGSVKNLNGHTPAGPWQGGKYTNWEGGTRVPFITRWPGHVKLGTSDAMICQVDLLASLARLVGAKVDRESAPDSQDELAVLLGESDKGRDVLVEQGNGPLTLAIRKENWKLISRHQDKKELPAPELYDLKSDPGETKDLAADHKDVVEVLSKLLKEQRER